MMESASTYRAVQAVAPGRLELVRKPVCRAATLCRGASPSYGSAGFAQKRQEIPPHLNELLMRRARLNMCA
jgi:hypothetical protein